MSLHSPVECVFELQRAAHDVRVWWAALDHAVYEDPLSDDVSVASVLSADEIARRDGYPQASRGRRFARGRAVLRRVLAEVTGEDASALRFVYNPDGKPSLTGDHAPPFSLSHARDAVVIVVGSGTRRVGVDVTWVHADTRFEHIAEHFFSPVERDALQRVSEAERRAAFCRIWVRKEAYLKGRGEGISQWIHSTDFSVLTQGSETEPAPFSVARDQDLWHVCDIPDAPEGYVASLAIERFRSDR